MTSRSQKHVRNLKKNHTWIWLIVFTVLIVISCFLVAFLVNVYSTSLINGKLDAERRNVQNMADIYEKCTGDKSDASSLLGAFGKEWFIYVREQDSAVPGFPDTCGIAGNSVNPSEASAFSPMNISAFIYEANVYPDTLTPVVEQDDEEVTIYVFDILSNIDPYIVPSDRKMLSDDQISNENLLRKIRFVVDQKEQMMKIPLWIGVGMSDGKSEFIARSYITFEMQDLVLLLVIVISIWVLVLISYIVMIINIITGIVRRRKTLRVFFTDAVTQGSNYMFFVHRGRELLKKYSNRSVRFFVVNLSFIGYRNYCVCHTAEEGERIIVEIHRIIQRAITQNKEICAHTAEADFALLLRDEDKDSIRTRVQAIMDMASHVTPDHVFTFQAGIETIEPASRSAERRNLDPGEIYNVACAARESLENDDAGIAFFDEKLIEDRRWAETVQEHQQAALDNEEFVVYYQPKYDPNTDELRGAEALIRWQSPEFGFIPPGRMIPIFEKNGFITEIDHYMITHVARDQKRWLDAGFKCVPVSVNVSRAHFIESDLAEQIRDSVDAEGAPHELVEIELTESAFFDDKKAMINTIEKLKSYGFAVSMDDFGSGYSSLNSLKDMPLDVLKLDAEFFRGENRGERGEIVVSEAIRLAKSLKMRTVAEGVEVREQVEFLAAQGCDMIQGYFYAKPMPAADYEVRMHERYKPKDVAE